MNTKRNEMTVMTIDVNIRFLELFNTVCKENESLEECFHFPSDNTPEMFIETLLDFLDAGYLECEAVSGQKVIVKSDILEDDDDFIAFVANQIMEYFLNTDKFSFTPPKDWLPIIKKYKKKFR